MSRIAAEVKDVRAPNLAPDPMAVAALVFALAHSPIIFTSTRFFLRPSNSP